jgi:flavorubredoxin
MWGATEKMAKEIAEGILACGIDVKLFEVNHTDRTQIIKEMYDAKGYIIGSSTHDNDMLPGIGGFLVFLRGLKPKNRIAATFGSYGWAGGATKCIEAVFREASIEIAQPALAIQYAPDQAKMVSCFEWGKAFAQKVKG